MAFIILQLIEFNFSLCTFKKTGERGRDSRTCPPPPSSIETLHQLKISLNNITELPAMSTNYRIPKFLPVVQVAQGVELLAVEVAEGQKAGHDQEEVQETEAV